MEVCLTYQHRIPQFLEKMSQCYNYMKYKTDILRLLSRINYQKADCSQGLRFDEVNGIVNQKYCELFREESNIYTNDKDLRTECLYFCIIYKLNYAYLKPLFLGINNSTS